MACAHMPNARLTPLPMDPKEDTLRYLQLLSEKFPTRSAAVTEIINLRAILSLPKGTEHYVSDLHGASNAFIHMVKNASGVVRKKVDEVYADTLDEPEKRALCALIYYPDERLELERKALQGTADEELAMKTFCRTRLLQVVEVARAVTVKYSRSKVRKLLPREFAYIIEELLHESSLEQHDRATYYNAIIDAIIDEGCAEQLLIAICYLIHTLTIDTMHIVGDIFDRGPGAQKIMDVLMTMHDYDIQWGNHDIEWMGAAMGNRALIATVLRISIRYANIETLEEGYGINLLPLANFAMETYGDDPCRSWQTRDFENNPRLTRSAGLMAKMHKAISIIQFKLEHQLIDRHPEWQMNDRLLLDKIHHGTITINGRTYPLTDTYLPTINPDAPYALSQEEEELMEQLARSFRKSEKLQQHLRCLIEHGSLFLVRNGFLLYHAAIPLNPDGSFAPGIVPASATDAHDRPADPPRGRELMETIDRTVREAYYRHHPDALDYMLYLWEGPLSPLYNKDKMTTLERYLIDDPEVGREHKGCYYELSNRRDICERILREFGLNPDTGRIVNGHIPVRTLQGESPMRAEGKRFVIDGGFSKPYQEKTGIAGYTLISNSHGIQLVEHEEFENRETAIRSGSDIHSRIQLEAPVGGRLRIADTDRGQELKQQIHALQQLLQAYETGDIKEH